ncbi:hypothetical protein AZH11_00895 [Pseudomonas simiae]|nr:hypothetical protein AZH11_00895 [Pseudomonas simiae]
MRNKPKVPGRKPTPETPDTSTRRPDSPDDGSNDVNFGLPGRIRPDGSDMLSDVTVDSPTPGTSHSQASVSVTPIADLAPTHRNVNQSPLQPYVQNPPGALSAHDDAGLRSIKGRHFADVARDDATQGIQTVMVGFHAAMKAYRAKLPTEQTPSGPPLYRIADSNTWSLKKPIEYYDTDRYLFDPLPNAQGYYAVHMRDFFYFDKLHRDIGFAFRDAHHRWVKVDPTEGRGDTSVPLKLTQWTDGEIWDLYRLEGAQALVFRSEVEASGKTPDWVTRVEEPDTSQFLKGSLRWLYPQKSSIECEQLLRSYNLTAAQQVRLRQEMANGPIPEWADQHKQLIHNKEDDQRFNLIAQELDPYIVRLREEGHELDHPLPPATTRYEDAFLESYVIRAGYKRTMHGALYRTDIPAMFRGDHRTPFELARDKRLIRLLGNPSDTTTKWALSATFSLSSARWYKDRLGAMFYPLHYNSQANRYPGRAVASSHDYDSDASGSSQRRESDAESDTAADSDYTGMGQRHESDVESDTSFEMDSSRGYPLRRLKQRIGFLYAIDTRDIEVVPGAENIYLNGVDFEPDTTEGRISMPTRGISAERIWLVNSQSTRAARVQDILEVAGDRVADIERATWDGTLGASEWSANPYDSLIDKVANALTLPKRDNTSANDIIWPVPEHYRP